MPTTSPASGEGGAPAIRSPWMWAALALGLLWLFTLIALWSRRGRVRRPPEPARPEPVEPATPKALREAFLRTVRTGDAASQARALLAWAQGERPGLRHLEAVAAALASDQQCAAIASLERARYAGADAGPGAAMLESAFAGGFAWRREGSAGGSADEPLPPLYPFKLH